LLRAPADEERYASSDERGKPMTVTAVVCTAFDDATDRAVFAVRDLVRAAGVELPDRPPHRPHFSLAAARVDRDELPGVLDVARSVAAVHRPIAITLSEVGRFGRAGVVWLGPRASPELQLLQHDADAALRRAGWPRAFGERSHPAHWVAHCTLATRVPKPLLRTVQAAVRAGYRPIDATVDALAVILVGGHGDIGYAPLG
jgi:2'-5' RNA ligase